MKILLVFLLLFAASCSLFDGLRKQQFVYTTAAQNKEVLKVQVPKGYDRKKVTTDSVGNLLQTYYYGDSTMLYFAYLADTTIEIQPIAEDRNVPLLHRDGGLIYKGVDTTGHYWREIRQQHLRFGYRNVPKDLEVKFDSSINQASLIRGRRAS